MPKAKPNTAEVIVRFRVPRGVSAARARWILSNHLQRDLYLDMLESELVGRDTLFLRLGKARIVRGAA